jgi:hypothetical protein
MFSLTARARKFLRLSYVLYMRVRIFQKILTVLYLRAGINHEWVQAPVPPVPMPVPPKIFRRELAKHVAIRLRYVTTLARRREVKNSAPQCRKALKPCQSHKFDVTIKRAIIQITKKQKW